MTLHQLVCMWCCHLLCGWRSVSRERRLRRDSSLCKASPSGTLPGSDSMAGEGAGLRANGTGQGSLQHVLWVSYLIRRDCSFTKPRSRSRALRSSRQNLKHTQRMLEKMEDLGRTDCKMDELLYRHTLTLFHGSGTGRRLRKEAWSASWVWGQETTQMHVHYTNKTQETTFRNY